MAAEIRRRLKHGAPLVAVHLSVAAGVVPEYAGRAKIAAELAVLPKKG